MTRLSDSEKHAIVRLLAQYTPPSKVVVMMRKEFGINIDRFQVRAYDPTNSRYEAGEKWRAFFEKERTAYLSSIEGIPIAHKAFRLNELQRMYFQAKERGNVVLAAAILAQAAKETGPILANGRASAADSALPAFQGLTSEERRLRVRSFLDDLCRRTTEATMSSPLKQVA